MRDRAKTQTRIDKIPDELCTQKEALQILGLKASCNLGTEHRFQSLQFAFVIYNGYRIKLYNRKAVEALKYQPPPDGYVDAKEVQRIWGITVNQSAVLQLMKRHSVPRVWVKAHHSYWVWERKAVEKLKKCTFQEKPRKKTCLACKNRV